MEILVRSVGTYILYGVTFCKTVILMFVAMKISSLILTLLTRYLCFDVNSDDSDMLQDFANQSKCFEVKVLSIKKAKNLVCKHLNLLLLQWTEACRTV
jgi:hypothetical protein